MDNSFNNIESESNENNDSLDKESKNTIEIEISTVTKEKTIPVEGCDISGKEDINIYELKGQDIVKLIDETFGELEVSLEDKEDEFNLEEQHTYKDIQDIDKKEIEISTSPCTNKEDNNYTQDITCKTDCQAQQLNKDDELMFLNDKGKKYEEAITKEEKEILPFEKFEQEFRNSENKIYESAEYKIFNEDVDSALFNLERVMDIDKETSDKISDLKGVLSKTGNILEKYISGVEKFKNISETLEVCISICKLFKSVHDKGYYFNGITASDLLITSNNECKLKDLDKIVSLDDKDIDLNIEKTCAPEIIRDGMFPNLETDRHTLAFIIFGILFKSDPFEGSKFLDTVYYSKEEEMEFYKNPVFIWNESDNSNRPVFGIHPIAIKYWNRYYTENIKNIFKQTFVEGLFDFDRRISEDEFISELYRFKCEKLLKLDSYTKENEKKQSKEIKDTNYRLCENVQSEGMQKNYRVLCELYPGLQILNSVVGYNEFDGKQVIGKVIENSKYKGVIGIKNLSNHTWIRRKNNEEKEIYNGKVLVIEKNIEIDFNPIDKSIFKKKFIVY